MLNSVEDSLSHTVILVVVISTVALGSNLSVTWIIKDSLILSRCQRRQSDFFIELTVVSVIAVLVINQMVLWYTVMD